MPRTRSEDTLPCTNILGVGISALNLPLAVEIITKWVEHREPCRYVCLRDVNGIVESQRDPELRYIHNNAGLVTPDGMPLVWLSHLAGHKEVQRVYGPDLMRALTRISAVRGFRQFYYGGNPGVAERLAEKLSQENIGLQVCGTYTPPFRPLTENEDRKIVETINNAHPDLLWVGLSSPKQEHWMAAHASSLEVPVMLGVGAAFDFLSGTKPQAPLWMQRSGLEWLFRLVNEPGRLWKRYLFSNPRFVWLSFLQLTGLRKFPMED